MKKRHFLLLMLLTFSINIFAQVGINTDEPNTNTAMHISERMKSTDPAINNKLKGVIIPRLTETERDKLTYSDAPLNATLRLVAADNSLMIFNTTENCYNFWNIEEGTWKSVCGNMGNAKFTFDCANLSVKGNYVKDKENDGTHYIAITVVNVTKPGAYIITATSNPDNGYSFIAQGTFTTTGTQTVKLYARGTPVTAQTDNFTISSSGSTSQITCTVPVVVQPNIAAYALNCSTIVVNGTYKKGTALSSTNTITIKVNVSSVGFYNISTTLKNGVTFSTSGIFSSTGTQAVTLLGSGVPSVNLDFDVEIISNTISGNASCTATIPVTLPAMTYAVIGADNVYTWHPSKIRAEAFNSLSFGPSGKVRMVSFNNLWNTTNLSVAVSNLNGINKPDVVLYFSYGLSTNTALATALSNYVNAGGVLIFGTADNDVSGTNILLNGIFGQSNAQQQVAGTGSSDDNVYQINNAQNDPIINGPFGNTAGKYWGEDNSSTGTILTTSLPENSIQIATASNQFSKYTVDPAYSTVWYNNNKNFVYFGDSVGASETSNSELEYPAFYNNGIPLTKRYGQWPNNSTQAQFIYNSILELNAVAWAIKKAANSGINPH